MIACVVLIFVYCWYFIKGQNEYYVSSTIGDDTNGNGSILNPFKTIQQAQYSIRNYIAKLPSDFNNNITVYIASGEYSGPLIFGLDDFINVNNKSYVIYSGMDKGDNVFISGGFNLYDNQWIESVKLSTNLSIYKTKLNSNQQSYLRNNEILQLFFDGNRMNLANSSVLHYKHMDTNTGIIYTNDTVIQIQNILSTDNYLKTLYISVFESWTASIHRATNVAYNTSNHEINITLSTKPIMQINRPASGHRFFLMNNYYFLSDKYDFYYNSSNNVLYSVFPSNININRYKFTVTNSSEVISITGNITSNTKVKRLYFKDFTISYADVDLDDCLNNTCTAQSASFLTTATIHTQAVESIHFHNVNVTHIGGNAVWFDSGSLITSYENSYISDMGCGGIRIGGNYGGQVPNNLIASNVTIKNNYIVNGGHFILEGTGILAQGMSNVTITHNSIGKLKYIGISLGWTWSFEPTTVENIYVGYNYVYDIGQFMLSDAGAIYTLGMQKNSIIENNICHDVWTYHYGGEGLHIDQGSTGIILRNNIIYNTKCSGYLQHYGLDNKVYNNIFAWVNLMDCAAATGHHPSGAVTNNQRNCICNITNNAQRCCSSFNFVNNIIYVNTTFNHDLFYDHFKTGYKNISFNFNTYWSVQQKGKLTFPNNLTIRQWKSKGKDINVTIGDPEFINAQKYNFNLKPTSPAFQMGFKQIDISSVGPCDLNNRNNQQNVKCKYKISFSKETQIILLVILVIGIVVRFVFQYYCCYRNIKTIQYGFDDE